MKKKTKYYSFRCPNCEWNTIGNWTLKMDCEFRQHFIDKHIPRPIIKTDEKEETKIA